jgi:hypothetical protein
MSGMGNLANKLIEGIAMGDRMVKEGKSPEQIQSAFVDAGWHATSEIKSVPTVVNTIEQKKITRQGTGSTYSATPYSQDGLLTQSVEKKTLLGS